ncbi:hypothetical protein BKA70DRAFT_1441550 [Coprinopsis sp. MPI-PUGE-AT-0042]|nr:hypothetical protein BKA70DRAFT_1441550 [Coprinopsis sp. MPI-PUGE-AT-0042]
MTVQATEEGEEDLQDEAHSLPEPPEGVEKGWALKYLRSLAKSLDNTRAVNVNTLKSRKALGLSYLCDVLEVDRSGVDMERRTAKRELRECIEAAFRRPETLAHPRGYSQRDECIFGADVMAAIRSDMNKTTWVTVAPANWGTTEHGTLSADN